MFLAQTGFTTGELDALEKFLNSGAVQVLFILFVLSLLLNIFMIYFFFKALSKMQSIQETTMKNAQTIINENNKSQNEQESKALELVKNVLERSDRETNTKLDNILTRFENVVGEMHTRMVDRETDTEDAYLTMNTYLQRVDAVEHDLLRGMDKIIRGQNGSNSVVTAALQTLKRLVEDAQEFWKDELRTTAMETRRQITASLTFKGFDAGFSFPTESDCRWRRVSVQIRNLGVTTVWEFPYRLGDKQVGRMGNNEEVWIIWDSGFPGWACARLVDMPEVQGFVDQTFITILPPNNQLLDSPNKEN